MICSSTGAVIVAGAVVTGVTAGYDVAGLVAAVGVAAAGGRGIGGPEGRPDWGWAGAGPAGPVADAGRGGGVGGGHLNRWSWRHLLRLRRSTHEAQEVAHNSSRAARAMTKVKEEARSRSGMRMRGVEKGTLGVMTGPSKVGNGWGRAVGRVTSSGRGAAAAGCGADDVDTVLEWPMRTMNES